MLDKKVEMALNEQINAEMWSAYMYLSMITFCHAEGQSGMASRFEVQFQEENAQTIIDNIKMIKDNGYGLYMLDKEFGTRTYTQASPLANAGV